MYIFSVKTLVTFEFDLPSITNYSLQNSMNFYIPRINNVNQNEVHTWTLSTNDLTNQMFIQNRSVKPKLLQPLTNKIVISVSNWFSQKNHMSIPFPRTASSNATLSKNEL